mgnify:CR=1 FL=1
MKKILALILTLMLALPAACLAETAAADGAIITVTGSGEITLIVDMTIVELSDVNGEITIDSMLQEAYSGMTPMNSCMSGDFPTLPPGNSTISWTGNVTYLKVQPNWRYL